MLCFLFNWTALRVSPLEVTGKKGHDCPCSFSTLFSSDCLDVKSGCFGTGKWGCYQDPGGGSFQTSLKSQPESYHIYICIVYKHILYMYALYIIFLIYVCIVYMHIHVCIYLCIVYIQIYIYILYLVCFLGYT